MIHGTHRARTKSVKPEKSMSRKMTCSDTEVKTKKKLSKSFRPTTCHVRQRYLERLGICIDNTNSTCYEKPLKSGCDQSMAGTTHVITPPSSLSDTSSSSQTPRSEELVHKRRRMVCFDDTVSVKPIPNRASYSERIRNEMYSSPEEFRRNFDRNLIEFDSENLDWRNVLEDDYFYTNKYTGEKIHPIHIHRIQKMQNRSPFDSFVEMSQWL